MHRLLQKCVTAYDALVAAFAALAGLLMIFVMVAVGYEVTQRYIFGGSLIWLHEVLGYSLLYITFLGAPWVLRHDKHVRIDILVERLPPRTKLLAYALSSVLIFVVCVLLTWYAARITWGQYVRGYRNPTIMAPPQWMFLIVIPVSTSMLCVESLRHAIRLVARHRHLGKDASDAPPSSRGLDASQSGLTG